MINKKNYYNDFWFAHIIALNALMMKMLAISNQGK